MKFFDFLIASCITFTLIGCGTKDDDNTADPIELEALAEIFSAEVCEKAFECCPDDVEGFSIERCKTELYLDYFEEWNQGLENNMMSYNAAFSGQCASEIQTLFASLNCDGSFENPFEEWSACEETIQGLVVENRSCEIEIDDDYYISDDYCEGDLSCIDSVCVKLVEAGGACDSDYGEGCVEDYYCNYNGNCVSYIEIGESCADEWYGCEFYCENDVCVADEGICQ